MNNETLFLLVLLSLCWVLTLTWASYWDDRKTFLQREKNMFLGSEITLSDKEVRVNNILMAAKQQEYKKGLVDPGSFPPAKHFFVAKEDIEQSEVFRIIKKFPKGACLHGHDSAMVSADFVVKNLTYMSNLYTCYDADGVRLFRFFERPDERCDWQLVSEMRQNCSNVTQLDEEFRQSLTLFTPNPRETYPNINIVWNVFENISRTIQGLMYYKLAFERYYRQLLQEFYEDNVMYLELRSEISGVFELDGSPISETDIIEIYKTITQQFIEEHPDFWGVKLIYSSYRQLEVSDVQKYILDAIDLNKQYPDLIVGFDLIGQEDLGKPLQYFADLLLSVRNDIKFFFHAGETDWEGMTDMNMVDAVLLNTTRIGHGYAIMKHPLVLEAVKEKGIAIEVSPLSNQVLMLLEDMRNHPAASLMAEGYPVVISADDPGFWSAKGLSYDMYEAFMGIAGFDADLKVLKQLALNSLNYSAMGGTEKDDALLAWEKKWNFFLDEILNGSVKRI